MVYFYLQYSTVYPITYWYYYNILVLLPILALEIHKYLLAAKTNSLQAIKCGYHNAYNYSHSVNFSEHIPLFYIDVGCFFPMKKTSNWKFLIFFLLSLQHSSWIKKA